MKIKTYYFLLLLVISSCVRQKFDVPKVDNVGEHEVLLYRTIAELRANMGLAGSKEIKENIVISGIVIADDRSGNFYKQIIIDDGTAAMPILLDAYNIYNDFPVGRKIFVKCKGLYTNYYYKLPQLGFAPDNKGAVLPIPFHLWDIYLVKDAMKQTVKPVDVSIEDAMKAKPELYNRLIRLNDAQIMDTLNTLQYALAPELLSATNIKLTDCDSNVILLRTSAYSKFHASKPQTGRGKITAIYTVFNNTPQLVLRDTADVEMRSLRCF